MLATDFSSVAVAYQRRLAAALLKKKRSAESPGTLAVAESDFTREKPEDEFDLVINSRAFQCLSSDAMHAAAANFYASLRPGGVSIIDTMNVQGNHRNLIEDSLIAAGFYLPFHESERWYRKQVDDTGIPYWMILDRPQVLAGDHYSPEQLSQLAERDQQILDSVTVDYERRCQDEADEVRAIVDDPKTVVANVVYSTG